MSGRSKQGKDKSAARAADMTQRPPPPDWVAHHETSDPAWDDSQAFPLPLEGMENEAQVVQRVRRHPDTGRLVDFCVAVQIRDATADEGWCEIERVDCTHGFVHVDRETQSGATEKDVDCVPADAQDDLDKAFSWALDYIWDIDERLKGWA